MLHPPKNKKAPRAVKRAVAHVFPSPNSPVTIVTTDAVTQLSGHDAFLNWLVAHDSYRSANAVYLGPSSIDWGFAVEPLAKLGYVLQVAQRKQDIATCTVLKRGYVAEDAFFNPIEGRSFLGRHTAGIVDVEHDLSPEDQCAKALMQLEELDAAIVSKWPARLGTSLAGTGINIFRTLLERPIGCAAHVSAQLRADRAVGGARAETYCPSGSTFRPPERPGPSGEMIPSQALGPWEIDIRSAYLSAMMAHDIPAEYDQDLATSQWHDPNTIVTAVVEVPECDFPPLRYESTNGTPCFPYGRFRGTWPSLELQTATRLGVRILAVLQVRKFVPRVEFRKFAEGLSQLRTSGSDYVQKAAKGIAVQTIGSWSTRPSLYRLHAGPWTEEPEGVRQVRPYIYEAPRDVPRFSDREILPANIATIGIVRSWIAELLPQLKSFGCLPLWVHTDGQGNMNDPRGAMQAMLLRDKRLDLLSTIAKHAGMESISAPRFPSPQNWKQYALAKTEVFSATRRISLDFAGNEHTAAGGVSRNLEPDEVRRIVRTEIAPRHWAAQRPVVHATGWTRAPHVSEIDPVHSKETESAFRDEDETDLDTL